MKLAYLTAGAAGMYCGSCMLDNALAKAIIRQGHECLLVPLYTPIRTDEEDVSLNRVFFGGINVYLQQNFFWARYVPRWLDGALNHPWLIGKLTANTGKTSPELLGSLAISMLRGTDGYQRKEVLRLCDWLDRDIQADAIILTNLLIGGCIPELHRRLKVPIFVVLQGDDIFLDSLRDHDRIQSLDAMKKLVTYVAGFIVHTHDYAQRMATLLDIPIDRCHVIPLGIDTREFQQPSKTTQTESPDTTNSNQLTSTTSPKPIRFRIGYCARLAPEKGLHVLVDGFIALTQLLGKDHFELQLAGWLGPQHEGYWDEQKTKLKLANLDENYSYLGSVDRQQKLTFLRSLDLFSVPTVYQDPKGLFMLEAIAAGVPYLQPNHGAFPELHARFGAGFLFDTTDQEKFNDQLVAIVQQLTDPPTDHRMPISEDRLANNSIGFSLPRNRIPSSTLIDEISIDTMASRFLDVVTPS